LKEKWLFRVQTVFEEVPSMKKALACFSFALLLFCIPFDARAYIYYQPPLTSSSAGEVSSAVEDIQVYDDFMLSSASSISTITWWGFYYDTTYTGDPTFSVTFYSDAGGLPGDPIVTSTIGSLITLPAYEVVNRQGESLYVNVYSIGLETSEFDADTRYWLSVYNTDETSLWGWQKSSIYDENFSGDFGAFQTEMGLISNVAFQLTGTSEVPLPPAVWLLGSGLIVMGVVGRRRVRTR
jgi:hypothetical protein